MNSNLFYRTGAQLIDQFSNQGDTVELWKDDAVYTVSVYIEGFSTKKGSLFFDNAPEARKAFQDAVMSCVEPQEGRDESH
jgi:hypothetical protein